MKVKEESEKVGLKLNIQKTKIMVSGPITSWQIDGETGRLLFWGAPKITADGACSHEIKRCLLLGKKYGQPRQYIKKQRHYFANNSPSSQGYGFSSGHVWMWELDYQESWGLNWCFWTVVLKKTSESLELQADPTSPSWRRSLLSVHWKDWCWSWNSSTLATSWVELTHWKRCWEGLGAGGEGYDRGWNGWMASLTRWTWVWVDSGMNWTEQNMLIIIYKMIHNALCNFLQFLSSKGISSDG